MSDKRKGGCVIYILYILTRGGGGQKSQNFADVLSAWPLMGITCVECSSYKKFNENNYTYADRFISIKL